MLFIVVSSSRKRGSGAASRVGDALVVKMVFHSGSELLCAPEMAIKWWAMNRI